ncbi:MAG: ECF transporter S component [Acutalibacteraceae bacterium]
MITTMQKSTEKASVFSVRTITVSAIVCALSIVFPQLFHIIGGNAMGNMFLPMHLPVIIGGFLLNPSAAMICGILSPLLSFFISGMPPFPRLIFMMFELGAYGFISSFSAQKLRLPVFLNLPLTWLGGRLIYFVSAVFALNVLNLEIQGMSSAWAAVWTAITTGFPGIILQAVTVPILVAALKKARLISYAPRFGKL